jgi:Raf kinase inhibitor-like YbhB/YbcL family protein
MSWVAVVTVSLAAVAACGGGDGDDERAEREPAGGDGSIEVSSTAFGDDEPIPERYTCDGDELSPPLAWTGVPEGVAELALVVRDPDADGFVHWVVAGLPAATTSLGEDALPAEAVETRNGFDTEGWAGPCPPEGDHTYEFTLYALAEPLDLQAGDEADTSAEAVESAESVATGTLEGTYERP